MLSIVLLILKIIGIILLSIIGILLFLILFTLFVPITYRVHGEIHNKVESISVSGNICWLIALTKAMFTFQYPDLEWKAYFLWFSVGSDDDDDDDEAVDESVGFDSSKSFSVEKEKHINTYDEKINRKEKQAEEKQAEEKQAEEKQKEEKQAEKKQGKKNKHKKQKKVKSNFRQTIRDFCDKIKYVIKKKDEMLVLWHRESTQHTVKKLKKELLYLWKHAKPRVLKINGELGFEDPSVTGQALAVIGVLYAFYGNAICINPNFEDTIYEGTFQIKGRTMLFPFAKSFLVLILDKRVMRTYRSIKRFQF